MSVTSIFQLDDAFHRTQRTSINLMWHPVPFVDIVVEFLAGTRQQEWPARLLESDPEWLDAQVLRRGSEAPGSTFWRKNAMPNATRLEWMSKYAAIFSALVAASIGIAQFRRCVLARLAASWADLVPLVDAVASAGWTLASGHRPTMQ